MRTLVLATVSNCTKFEMPRFTRSKEMMKGLKFEYASGDLTTPI